MTIPIKNNHNKRLNIALAGALAFHILALMIVWVEVPSLKLPAPLTVPPIQLDISSLRTTLDTTNSNGVHRASEQQLLDQLQAIHLKKTQLPRKRTIASLTKNNHDANYMVRWQTYIEAVGNEHYPARARQNNIRGNLRLLVAINKNGSIKEIKIRQSSGHRLLDEAAINIVKQAAPFEPLPPEMTKDIDVLEIIRTWQFTGSLSAA